MGFALGMGKFTPSNLLIKQSGVYRVELNISETDTTGDWEISKVRSLLVIDKNEENTWGVTASIIDSGKDYCVVNIDATNAQFTQSYSDHLSFDLWVTTEGSFGNDAYQYTYNFNLISLEGYIPELPDIPEVPIIPEFPIEPDTPIDGVVRVGNITAFPDSLYFPATGGSVEMLLVSDVEVEQWEYAIDSRFTVTTKSQTRTEWAITITLNEGNLDNPNSTFTTFSIYAYYDTEHSVYDEITPLLTIGGNQIVPIWRDTFCEFPENYDSIKYSIESGNEIIYSGKATKYPSEYNVKINVNRVVKDYLDSHFNSFGDGTTTALSNFVKEVTVKADDKIFATYNFYNSWGYSPYKQPVLSDPIRNLLDERQYFMCSLYPVTFGTEVENGTYKYQVECEDRRRTYTFPISYKYQRLICDDLKNYDKPISVNVNTGLISYDVKKTCYDYCLYYVNAYGGWDSLLIKGNVKKSDKITSSYYSKTFDNTTLDFEKVKYHNNITTTYQLYTDWFTDEEQSKLHHLLESTEVYLHNLDTDEILPVVITNSKCDWKTFTNNGKKKFYNEINVECSQTKIRL